MLPSDWHNSPLFRTALKFDNLLVAPDISQLNGILMSDSPLDAFARLVSSRVKVTRISPYKTGGGIDNDAVFFGREQLLIHILQREPANYLLVGGRQLGKSSLLKAVKRRYSGNPSIHCHYLHLSGAEFLHKLSPQIGLPATASLPEIVDRLSSGPLRLFLVDESDLFIAAETRDGCPTLQHFRALSEEGKCWFIFAGYWDLYYSVVFDYRSPIKNFGEILTVEALEPDASRLLASQPMAALNISYESEQLIDTILHETGRRANLIAIVCNEILQHLDLTDRVIREKHLQHALESDAIRNALRGWGILNAKNLSATFLDRESRPRLTLIFIFKMQNEKSFVIKILQM